jgi:hypothetical protein
MMTTNDVDEDDPAWSTRSNRDTYVDTKTVVEARDDLI